MLHGASGAIHKASGCPMIVPGVVQKVSEGSQALYSGVPGFRRGF